MLGRKTKKEKIDKNKASEVDKTTEDCCEMNEFMAAALKEAKDAAKKGEVPIGAVIVFEGKIISRAHNMREKMQNAIAHAEVLAIDSACNKMKSWRLDDCEMYVTLQPCVMCAGAILNARIKKVYIGMPSDRTNDLNVYKENNLNHKTEVEVMNCEECGQILKDFFEKHRG